MLTRFARLGAALFVGAFLAWPAMAQDKSKTEMGKDINNPPITAPTKNAGPKPVEPPSTVQAEKTGKPPVPIQGSTAVPGWNIPPDFRATSQQPQYASVPGINTNVLIQADGRKWREFRIGPITRYGGYWFALVLAVLTVFYLVRGPMRVHGQLTGRLIERFNAVERTSHWIMAISFSLLALTGIIILWGKHIILPWLGYAGFSWLVIVSKNAHNFLGPLFIFSLVVMFLLFVKDNIPRAYDMNWLKKAGGMFGGPEVPSGKFNAGEKVWFWLGIFVLGTVVSVTGLILDFPNWMQGRQAMQQANVIHAIAAIIYVGISFGHIYLGTIGMPGAYQAMAHGYVDEQWAKEHHGIWYDEVKAGKRPERMGAPSGMQPAPGDD